MKKRLYAFVTLYILNVLTPPAVAEGDHRPICGRA